MCIAAGVMVWSKGAKYHKEKDSCGQFLTQHAVQCCRPVTTHHTTGQLPDQQHARCGVAAVAADLISLCWATPWPHQGNVLFSQPFVRPAPAPAYGPTLCCLQAASPLCSLKDGIQLRSTPATSV